jgi:WD40 repeat protein
MVLCLFSPRGIHAQQLVNSVSVVAWSNTNQFIAFATTSIYEIEIFDQQTQQTRQILAGHFDRITDLVWSPDDQQLASGSIDRTIQVWDVETGELVHTLSGHSDSVNTIGWSHDGSKIFSSSILQESGEFFIWNTQTGQLEESLPIGGVLGIGISSVSGWIALTGFGGDITILEQDLSIAQTLINPNNFAEGLEGYQLAWHPSEVYLASGHLNGSILVWNVSNGQFVQQLSGSTAEDIPFSQIRALRFDPTGTRLLSVNGEGLIRVWDTQSWQLLSETQISTPIYGADWNLDGTTLLYGTDNPHPAAVLASDLDSFIPTTEALSGET